MPGHQAHAKRALQDSALTHRQVAHFADNLKLLILLLIGGPAAFVYAAVGGLYVFAGILVALYLGLGALIFFARRSRPDVARIPDWAGMTGALTFTLGLVALIIRLSQETWFIKLFHN